MLVPAILYKDQLIKKHREIWFDDKYTYWNSGIYWEDLTVNTDTWNEHQFVSVYNGEIIGYIAYSINRSANIAYSLNVLKYSNHFSATFSLDLGQALQDIFEKFHFNKLNFSVIIGNPIEESYDRIIDRYNGRIVGTYKDHVRLQDGKLCDQKLYEIMSEEYFKAKKDREDKKNVEEML